RLADMGDGLSRTVAFSETIKGRGPTTTGGSPQDPLRQFAEFTASAAPTTPTACLKPDQWTGDRGREWSRGSFIMASYNHFYVPNSPTPDCTNSGRAQAITAARSLHPGGVNSLFCDGHVQYAKNSVNLKVWQALSTRNGNEVISDSDF